ncbi:MAG: peptidyl-prolyl cis-trans isomerase [Proteobacteria bacterium]|nr:peptidyl-prolyl cis-trans isomerase [Pseudomonadota bacterium]
MLQFFRNFFKTGTGVAVTLGFVGLIGLAFAGADIASSGSFGGVAGGDRVASIGRTKISTSELIKAATFSVEAARRDNPQMTMKSFLAQGGLDQVLEQLLDGSATGVFGDNHGIVAGKRLIDSELAKAPALQGLDGKFSESAYRQLLAQRQMTDAEVRQDIGQGLISRQVLTPAAFAATAPNDLTMRYAAMLKEQRSGVFAALPSAVFAAKTLPGNGEILAWYGAHKAEFMRPERRVIRWATFSADVVKNVPAPTEAAIAARYQADKAKYAASESRKLVQLILPTEAAARAIAAEVARGGSLDAAARAKGLSTATLGPLTREAYGQQASSQLADAVFAAARGARVGPVKGALGWTLVEVTAIDHKAGRSLDQARGEIVTALTAENRRKALTDYATRIDEEFGKGGALSDAAKEIGVTLQQTAPLTADGKVYGKPGESAPKELARALQAAFAMESESKPQISEIEAGKTLLIFDVSQITPAAPAPLAEVQNDVAAAIRLEQGMAKARVAALQVLAAAKKGTDLGTATRALNVPLPALSPVTMSREQMAMMGERVPPAVGLLFAMAPGTVKIMPAPRNSGWLVVRLDKVVPGNVPAGDPLLAAITPEMGKLVGREYVEQLRRAIRTEVGVKRNQAGIKAVIAQLSGTGAQ